MVAPQSSANFPIFRGHARQRGRGFGALAQTLGRTAIPFIKKYTNPAAKRIGADWRSCQWTQKTQNICKRCWNKNSSKTVGRWKKEIQA